MSSMNNTRKDIADRLGSAQPNNRPGEKAKFGRIDSMLDYAKKLDSQLDSIRSDVFLLQTRRLGKVIGGLIRAQKSNDESQLDALSNELNFIRSEANKVCNEKFSRPGVKVQFALSPSEIKENQRRIETNIRYESSRMREFSLSIKYAKEEIERLTAEIKNTRDIKRKAKLSLKLDVENKKTKDYIRLLQRARQMIHENQADAKSLGITLDPKWSGNFARPGAKAKFEYSQSDYMALLRYYKMAMDGNPNAFEGNTAERLAKKAIASPNYRPNPNASSSHDLAKELLEGLEDA